MNTFKVFKYTEENNYDLFMGNWELHSLIFDSEPDRFLYTTDILEADIIPTMMIGWNYHIDQCEHRNKFIEFTKVALEQDKLVLGLRHTHVDDEINANTYYQNILDTLKQYTNKFLIVNTDFNAEKNHPNVICYDTIMNRQKIYYNDELYNNLIHNKYRLWSTYASKEMYVLPEIKYTESISKKFLICNRCDTHETRGLGTRIVYRHLFQDIINRRLDTYMSNWDRNPPEILHCQQQDIDIRGFSGFWPPHNDYFTDSIVNVYIESLVGPTEITYVSEKTHEPMHKGQFILPFGYCGIVKDILSYGYRLPDWINYDYDIIEDKFERFAAFKNEFIRLGNISLEELIKFRNKDLDILLHNRNVIENYKLDSLYEKIIKKLEMF